MYTQDELKGMVIFDLETSSEYRDLDELSMNKPSMAELWSKRCEYLRSRWPEDNENKTDEELYELKAALVPEFNRIVCASFGRYDFREPIPKMVIKSYYGDDENEILNGIEAVVSKFTKYKMTGHNIKRFDIPVMCKRFLINGYTLPPYLQVHNKKPWEMPFIDTSENWSFGAWQEGFASLELLMSSLGLETPKDDIRGEDVPRVFWNDGDHKRIATYCEKDVYAVGQALLKMSGLTIMEELESSIV
jgi:DNA polymerase elongation subunit (family B)